MPLLHTQDLLEGLDFAFPEAKVAGEQRGMVCGRQCKGSARPAAAAGAPGQPSRRRKGRREGREGNMQPADEQHAQQGNSACSRVDAHRTCPHPPVLVLVRASAPCARFRQQRAPTFAHHALGAGGLANMSTISARLNRACDTATFAWSEEQAASGACPSHGVWRRGASVLAIHGGIDMDLIVSQVGAGRGGQGAARAGCGTCGACGGAGGGAGRMQRAVWPSTLLHGKRGRQAWYKCTR